MWEWEVYRCYRKINSRRTCPGQSTYKKERVEDEVIRVVRAFLSRIRTLPQGIQLDAAMQRERQIWNKRLKDAESEVTKAAKAVTALEEQAILALTGECALDLSIINQLMPKKKNELAQTQKILEQIREAYEAEEARRKEKQTQLTGVLRCAEIFDNATREEQHMIIARLVRRVDIGRGYEIKITMNMSLLQFLTPEQVGEILAAA